METKDRARRIADLEAQLLDVERQLTALHQGRDPALRPPPPPPRRPAMAPPRPSPPPHPTTSPYASIEWVLRVGGIALVVLAVGFFVSTAISRGWVGPTAQLVLATLASLAMIGQSFRFTHRARAWRLTFAAGGAAALFASGVVGFVGLELLSFPAAFGWLAGSIVAFLGLSRLHASEMIAVISAPAMLIGVRLLSVIENADGPLLALTGGAYVLVIAATTWQQGWYVARPVGAFLGATIAFAGLAIGVFDGAAHATTVVALVAAVSSVTVATGMQAMELRPLERAGGPPLLVLAALEARVTALAIPWAAASVAVVVGYLLEENWDFGWTIGVVGLLAGIGVTALSRSLPPTMLMLHQVASAGVVFIGASLALEGSTLLLVLLGQAVTTAYLAERTRRVEMVLAAVVVAAATTLGTVGYMVVGAIDRGLTAAELASTALVVVTILYGTWRYRAPISEQPHWIVGWLAVLGWIASLRLAVPQGDMIVSLLWAGVGTAMIIGGARAKYTPIIWGGLATLGATAAKLVLIDFASVDVLWRAGLFFAVGALFLRLAFVVPELLEEERSRAPIEPGRR